MTGARRGGLAAALLAAAACGARTEPTTLPGLEEGVRPSVVLILVEDADVAAVQYMPHLRSQVTSRGLTFTNAFATTPAATPSRVSVLTGRYAHGHGVLGNRAPMGSFRRWQTDAGEQDSLATWLQAAGYRTAMIGRYLDAYPRPRDPEYTPPGWDVWHGLFSPERYLGFKLNEGGEVREYGPEAYQSDVLGERATGFLDALRPGQRFFLQLSFAAPASPSTPAGRHAELFPDLQAPRGEAFDEADVSDKPAWLRERPLLGAAAVAGVDERFRARVLSLQAVDEAIAAVVGTLRARGRLEDTYVVFSAAHGFPNGAHRLAGVAGEPYDPTLRVPLVLRGPGLPENRQLPQLALNIDLAPTVAELCGLAPRPGFDGASLVPLLGAEAEPVEGWRRDFLVEHWDRESDGVPQYAALRSAKQLYVEYADEAVELYDLTADPEQLANAAGDADAARLEAARARLAELRECSGEACRTLPPETEEDAETAPDIPPGAAVPVDPEESPAPVGAGPRRE